MSQKGLNMSNIAETLRKAAEKAKTATTKIADDVVNIYDDVSDKFEEATDKLEEKYVGAKNNVINSFGGRSKTTITNNGKSRTIVGGSITIKNGELWVDGKRVDDSEEEAENGVKIVYRDVVVEGGCDKVNTEDGDITVHGACGRVNTMSGDVEVAGDVNGDVKTMSGDVEAEGSISGSVSTMSGDIKSRKCKGDCSC